jgi:Tfp pilus assembly protein PilO
MVNLQAIRRGPLFLLDLLGGSFVAACLIAVAWLTLLREDRSAAALRDLRGAIATAKGELATIQLLREQQEALVKARRAELETRGQIPEKAPIHEYFQELSRLAHRHRLQVRSQGPLPPQSYPGLVEDRYSFEVMGTMTNMARFLREIEQSAFWADVSHLKIESAKQGQTETVNTREALLTISLFSVPPERTDEMESTG